MADFLELGELMCRDALVRDESCGCHLREDHQTEDGEAVRDDKRFQHVSVWEWTGAGPGADRAPRAAAATTSLEPVTRSYAVNVTLRVWRQEGPDAAGAFEDHEVRDIDPNASLLEAFDVLNEDIVRAGGAAIAFDSDCREGICGACSMTINGAAARRRDPDHDAARSTCASSRKARRSPIEPFWSRAFPVIRDLIVDRSALDRIQQAGGYTGVTAGPKPEPNSNPVDPQVAEEAIDAAVCIGCGACVAACPNGAAMLFTGAKITHLALLPQGQPGRYTARAGHGRADGRRGLRGLHEPRRVRAGVPGGHLHPRHRADEPRAPRGGAVPLAQPARRHAPAVARGRRRRPRWYPASGRLSMTLDRTDLDQRDGPRDECGVFGIYGPEHDVSRLAYFALYALQHRGQESAGIAAADTGGYIITQRALGLVNQVFKEHDLLALAGDLAIGHATAKKTAAKRDSPANLREGKKLQNATAPKPQNTQTRPIVS